MSHFEVEVSLQVSHDKVTGRTRGYRVSETCVCLTVYSVQSGSRVRRLELRCTVAVQCAGSYHEQGYWEWTEHVLRLQVNQWVNEHFVIWWSPAQAQLSSLEVKHLSKIVDGFSYSECFRRSIWSLCSPQARRERLQGCHSAWGTVLQCWEASFKTQCRRQIQRRWG